ncbi:hypothetical protein AAFF_G00429520 [Aldrovandia affinis]|uniref:Uncharacterized protein n=1 Tax=Aldrovandia affinis TaxID=143900 RepID=A0AAD7R3N4_9TELE|nr:hypothetical protein AAFF_G00429520 [Aldrovandia affinis]
MCVAYLLDSMFIRDYSCNLAIQFLCCLICLYWRRHLMNVHLFNCTHILCNYVTLTCTEHLVSYIFFIMTYIAKYFYEFVSLKDY